MVKKNKNNVLAAVAGAVVGAGAVLAGAVVLADKKKHKKISEVIAKGQSIAKQYVHEVNSKANKLVNVAKTAEKGVKNI